MATKLEMIKREQRIRSLMGEGRATFEILSIVAEEYKVTENAIRKQYELILKDIQKLMKEERHNLRATLMARQDEIFKEAMSKKNLKVALESTNAQAKLGGLYEHEVSEAKRPEAIIFKEKDFSAPLAVVPPRASSDE